MDLYSVLIVEFVEGAGIEVLTHVKITILEPHVAVLRIATKRCVLHQKTPLQLTLVTAAPLIRVLGDEGGIAPTGARGGQAAHQDLAGHVHPPHAQPVEKITLPLTIGVPLEFVAGVGVIDPVSWCARDKVAIVVFVRTVRSSRNDIKFTRGLVIVKKSLLPIGHGVHAPRVVKDD